MAFLIAFIVISVSLAVSSFLGYAVHWTIHQTWSGPFYRAHMAHHLEHYPPSDLVSDEYRKPKWYENGNALFAPFFVALTVAILWALPLGLALLSLAVLSAYSFANSWVHDQLHLRSTPLRHVPSFERVRSDHFLHHSNMRRNYGIFEFVWDHVFGTYRPG